MIRPAGSFQVPLPQGRARALPPATVIAGSLLATWPMVANAPTLPPFGLLMLLAWRLLAPASLRLWSSALLGFADDLVSGQPLGSATLLWTLAFLSLEFIDRRLVFRSFKQEWLIAAGMIAGVLVAGRYIASPVSARVDLMLWAQIVAAILLFPVAGRICAWIDYRRGAA